MAFVSDEIDKTYSREEMAKIIVNLTEEILLKAKNKHFSKKEKFRLNIMTALVLSELKVWAYKDYGLITNIDKL